MNFHDDAREILFLCASEYGKKKKLFHLHDNGKRIVEPPYIDIDLFSKNLSGKLKISIQLIGRKRVAVEFVRWGEIL